MNEFLQALSPLTSMTSMVTLPMLAVFARISMIIFFMPGFGSRVIPTRIKLILTLLLTTMLTPVIGLGPIDPGFSLFELIAAEVFVGFFIGFSLRAFIWILSFVGTIVAQAMSLSQIFGAGPSEDANTTVSTILTLAGATLFLTLDYHIAVLSILIDSYQVIPLGQVFAMGGVAPLAERAIELGARVIVLSVLLSMPFLLLNLAYNSLLGILNRAMPQLMVTFVGIPAITLAGIFLLGMTITMMFVIWLEEVRRGLGGLFG